MKKNVEQKIDETLGAQNSAPVFQDLKQKTKRKGAKSEIDTNQIIIDDLLNVEKDDKQEDKNAQENVKEEVVLKDAEPSLKKNENLESAEAKNDDKKDGDDEIIVDDKKD